MRFLVVLLPLLVSCASLVHRGSVSSLKITQAGEIKWEPAAGLTPGIMAAVQYGDPSVGPYEALIKFPTGALVAPHYHKADEFATVASGTILLGTGETVNESKAVKVDAGGYIHIPAGVAHWAKCVTDAVIVRFSPGPRELTPCSPDKPAPNKASAPRGVAAKNVAWAPGAELGPAVAQAVPYGDPKTSPHVFYLKFPAGVARPPHYHSYDECVTVLSGTLHFGQGETFDESKAVAVAAGGTIVVPARSPHWVFTKDATFFTVTQNGPRDIVYCSAAGASTRSQ